MLPGLLHGSNVLHIIVMPDQGRADGLFVELRAEEDKTADFAKFDRIQHCLARYRTSICGISMPDPPDMGNCLRQVLRPGEPDFQSREMKLSDTDRFLGLCWDHRYPPGLIYCVRSDLLAA